MRVFVEKSGHREHRGHREKVKIVLTADYADYADFFRAEHGTQNSEEKKPRIHAKAR